MAGSTRLRYFAALTQRKHGSTRLKTFYGSAFAASAPRSSFNNYIIVKMTLWSTFVLAHSYP